MGFVMQRDWQLTFRLAISFLVLTLIYLAFLSFISVYFGLGVLPISIIAVVMIGAQWFFSDRIVLWSTGTKLVTRDEQPLLHEIVENLAQKANLPKPRVGIMQSNIPNAFATGKGPKSSVVVVSSEIMKILNREELEGVLSHEVTHIRHRDVTIITLASVFSTIAWYIMQSSLWGSMWGGYGYDNRRQQGGGIFLILIVAALVWFLSFLIIRAISRYRELAADRGGAYLTGKPLNLSHALTKIEERVRAAPTQELRRIEGQNAFFIIPAISGSTIAKFFSTHPPLGERIRRLQEIEQALHGTGRWGF